MNAGSLYKVYVGLKDGQGNTLSLAARDIVIDMAIAALGAITVTPAYGYGGNYDEPTTIIERIDTDGTQEAAVLQLAQDLCVFTSQTTIPVSKLTIEYEMVQQPPPAEEPPPEEPPVEPEP